MGNGMAMPELRESPHNLNEQQIAAMTADAVMGFEALLREQPEPQPEPAHPETAGLPTEDRALTEVDNLNRHRQPDGTHSQWALGETLKNMIPYVKEAGMPSAVSRTYQEYVKDYEDEHGRRDTFMWLGKTALKVALSGYDYHKHEAAHSRVAIEVEEARDGEQTMRPGYAKVLLSPKMSRADAPYDVARSEHLGDDDSLRISWLDLDEAGNTRGRYMESVLVSDVALEDWVRMLADSNNIFGKSVLVENPESALSVMQVFRELELPLDALPKGVVSLVGAVLPYMKDETARQKVAERYMAFQEDQASKHERALNIAERWRNFTAELSDGIAFNYCAPNSEVTAFVYQNQHNWLEEDAALIRDHQMPDGSLYMTRRLAGLIARAKEKLVADEASIVTGERHAREQLAPEVFAELQARAERVQWLYTNNQHQEAQRLEVLNNNRIAMQNMANGGGCAGGLEMRFRSPNDDNSSNSGDGRAVPETDGPGKSPDENDRSNWKEKIDICIVKNCPTRPGKVKVGPCRVCIGRCQEIYDKGGDPTKGLRLAEVLRAPEPDKKLDKQKRFALV
ncbi:MAG TPA: hypothetical protein VLG11_03265 [Candidatus Saccharimonadales bacterium]|nr:hypothetical protein [Candidatus Saccharimonadales bacterium]